MAAEVAAAVFTLLFLFFELSPSAGAFTLSANNHPPSILPPAYWPYWPPVAAVLPTPLIATTLCPNPLAALGGPKPGTEIL